MLEHAQDGLSRRARLLGGRVRLVHLAGFAQEPPRERHVHEAEERREQPRHRVPHGVQASNVTATQVADLAA
jgi:hypothetical protein